MSLVEQELLALPEQLSSPQVFSGVSVTRSLVLCVNFCRSLLALLYSFLLAIALYVRLRFTDSDYPFGILKLLLITSGSLLPLHILQNIEHYNIEIHKFIVNAGMKKRISETIKNLMESY